MRAKLLVTALFCYFLIIGGTALTTQQEPILKKVEIIVETLDDDKDSDTTGNINIFGKLESQGESRLIASGTIPEGRFTDNSTHLIQLASGNNIKLSQVAGITTRIQVNTIGNDIWRFRYRLVLTFSDGSVINQTGGASRVDHNNNVVVVDTPVQILRPTPSPTSTVVPTATATPIPTASPTPVASPTPRATVTPKPTQTPQETPSPLPSTIPSSTPISSIDEQIKNLVEGIIAYDVPRIMKVGEHRTIKIGIARKLTQDIQVWLKQDPNATSTPIPIDNVMDVELSSEDGKAFDIKRQHPAGESGWQAIDSQEAAEWIYDVQPLKSGTPSLTIRAFVKVIDPSSSNREIRSHKVFEDKITVSTNLMYYLLTFLKNNWQWLWTALLVPIGAWLWKRRKRSGPPDPPDWETV